MGQYTKYRAYLKYRRPSGSTQAWQLVLPMELSYTDGSGHTVVIEENSTSCGYVPEVEPIYRWVNVSITSDYICQDYNKYYKQKKQVSYDNGATYSDVSPAEYRTGGIYETNSVDCGYIEPSGYKAVYTLSDNSEYHVSCNSSSVFLFSDDNVPYSVRSAATEVAYGTCIDEISSDMFSDNVDFVAPLSSVTFPSTLERISGGFRTTHLQSVYFPEKLNNINSPQAFKENSYLTGITVDPDNPYFDSRDNCNAVIVKSGATTYNTYWTHDTLFLGCKTTTIPLSVDQIKAGAMMEVWGLEEFTIPSRLTYVGLSVLAGCKDLKRVVWEYSAVTRTALQGCSSLSSVTLGDNVSVITNYAFEDCTSLSSITLPNALTTIGNWTFNGCSSLSSISIPSNVTEIGYAAFNDCSSLSSITVNATIPPTLGDIAFDNTNNCPIYVPSGSYNDYIAADVWNDYAQRIQVIP